MAIKMKHKKRGSTFSLIIMLVLLLAGVAAIILWPTPSKAMGATPEMAQDDVEQSTLVKVGDVAPDFTVKMFDGSKVSLSQLTGEGKVVMITFWATWCPPCREELSHLQTAVIDKFKDTDLVVLPISRGEESSKVANLLTKMNLKFNVGLDPEQDIYRRYATNYIPRTFIVDRDGRVAYLAVGYDAEIAQEVDATLTKMLRR